MFITDAPAYSTVKPNYLELNFRAFMLNKSGADGFSVTISSDINVNTSNNFENGIIGSSNQGLVIRFKTWNTDTIELVTNGTVVSTVSTHTLEDGNWKDYKVTIKPDNTLTLVIAGTTIFNNVVLTGYTNLNPSIAFAARTGGSSNEHIIDDVVIKDLRPYEYSLDNATWQSSNVFANQTAGNYTVYGRLPGMVCGDVLGTVIVAGSGVAAPTAVVTQVYTGSGTIANLTATGTNLKWYTVATGGVAIGATTALTNGFTYYVTQTIGTCESTSTAVKVQKISESVQTFCNTATVANLVSTPTAGATSAWFTTASGGTALTGTTALATGTYYVEQQVPLTGTNLVSGLNNPSGVAIQSDGKIVVADAGNNAVKRMNADGTGIETLGSGFSDPNGVAIQTDGKIIVANITGLSFIRMNADGTGMETFSGVASTLGSAFGLALEANNDIVYYTLFQIKRRNNATGVITTLASALAFPQGLAIQTDGKIVVADTSNNVVKRMDADGSNIVTLGSGFNGPRGIVIQADGKIVVVDSNNSKLKRMNADGSGIVDIATIDGRGLAIEADGKFIVLTTNGIYRIAESSTSNRVPVTVVVSTPPVVNISGANTISIGGTTTLSPVTGGTWASSNTAVATVTNAGVVTGVSAGTATFTFTNTTTGCTSLPTGTVTINAFTTAPTAVSPQVYAGSGTIANLTASGTAIKWYAATSGGLVLATTTALFDGTTYFASQTVSGLESATRVAVLVRKISEPTQILCSPATVANLVSAPSAGATAAWFTTTSGGTALTSGTALATGPYYVEQQISPSSTTLALGFSSALGIAIQSDGKIVVADNINNLIKRMDADGTNVVTLGSGFSSPRGVAIQADGRIVVVETLTGLIKRMNADGTNIVTLFASSFPYAVAIQADGKIVFLSYPGTVTRINADGTNSTILVSTGLGNSPLGIAIQSDGKIVVADTNNNAIKRMDADGSNLVTLGSGFNNPNGVAIQSDGKIVVADSSNSKLKRMNADGTAIVIINSVFAAYFAIQTDGKFIVSSADRIYRIAESSSSNRVSVRVIATTPTDNVTKVSACGSYTWNGTVYKTSGIKIGTTTNCVTEKLDLTIAPSTVNNAVTQSSGVLIATQTGATYQWYKCPSTLLKTEINQSYTPTASGDYKVEVTSGVCNVTSSCITVATLGNDGFDKTNFSYYPNPTSNILHIQYSKNIESVSVINLLGQVMFENKTNSHSVEIDLSNLPIATYSVKVKAYGNEKIIKVVKE